MITQNKECPNCLSDSLLFLCERCEENEICDYCYNDLGMSKVCDKCDVKYRVDGYTGERLNVNI